MLGKNSRELLITVFSAALSVAPAFSQAWIAQGPGPTVNGQAEGIVNNPVSGSINAIGTVPGDANTVYLGTTNGGVWKSSNATLGAPTWTPLTDQALSASSISSIAVSPLDSAVVFAGTGSTSSLSFDGSTGIGLAKSTDGGTTWSVLAAATFTGKRIVSVVPTSLGAGATQVVLAATLFDGGGVYRSADGGTSFTRISGGSGLPNAGVSSIVADPSNTSSFYAGVPANGIYRSVDGGLNWSPVNGTISAAIRTNSQRILLSVSAASPFPIYAAFISNNAASGVPSGKLSGAFRSPDLGVTWTSLTLPSPEIFPGSQGVVHGSIAAHPTNVNVVFLAGDRQNDPFTNSAGCNNYSANTYRNDTGVWASVVCNGASGTSPHADSRAMAFDANGNLLQANDGGIYRLNTPDVGTRAWVSINNNIQPAEMHSVAYDPFSSIIFGGTQDTGTPIQSAPGSTTWNELIQGDGGNVAVDADQTAHPGTSIRYTSFQQFGFFNRTSWNSANTMVGGLTTIPLNISGGGTVFGDPNLQFYTPFVLNKITPSRMLIGTANIYESANKGDLVTNLGFTGAFISGMVYGGKLGGVANPEVFYVAAGASLRRRTVAAGAITTIPSPGGTVRAVAMDPENHQRVFIVDDTSKVFMSSDAGATWVNISANLPSLTGDVRTIEVFGTDANGRTTRLLVGGAGGVYQMRRPGAAGTSWTLLGTGMPRSLVYDLHYDFTNNVLVAGLLGRGAWTMNNPFGVVLPPGTNMVTPTGQPGSTVPFPVTLPPPPPAANGIQ